MIDTPAVHIQANHLWALIVLAGALCEHEDRHEDMPVVEAARELLDKQAGAWLCAYLADWDQYNAAHRDGTR